MSSSKNNKPDLGFAAPGFPSLLAELEQLTPQLEPTDTWPHKQLELVRDAGVLGWVIPTEHGGANVSSAELILGYEQLASACLTTTFVLTQRNGACQRIAGSEHEILKAELLPPLCAGETFATVGISHLTTSRQHLARPAVEVQATDNGFLFNGTVPWVTGANEADFIVTGGTCPDGKQILAAIPTSLDGVSVQQPPKLLALNASQTGAVGLENVEIERRYLIAGPVEGVMKRGQGGGTGSLTTSALAIGAAGASLRRLKQEAERREDLVEIHTPLNAEHDRLSADMYESLAGVETAPSIESIRKRANSLVLRSSQALLAATKGAGFVSGHPAERAIREAMFFLVWSCPQPVLTAALREFACVVET